MQEEWKQVIHKGREWPYTISNLGHICNKGGKLLSCSAGVYNYPRVTLWDAGEQETVVVHLLVARLFLGLANGREVRHKDRDTENNCVSNLVYGTAFDNENDKIRHGTHRCFQRKLSLEKEYRARKERAAGKTYSYLVEKYQVKRGAMNSSLKTPFVIGNVKEWILSDIEEDGVDREIGEQVLFTLSRIGYLKVL